MNIRQVKFFYSCCVNLRYRNRADRIEDCLLAFTANKNNLQHIRDTVRLFRGE